MPQVTKSDADRQDYYQTQMTIYDEKPLTEAMLIDLFRLSPENIRRIPVPESEAQADIVIVLGYDYNPCRR